MENSLFSDAIVPTDVRIYYDDGMPYLDYTGITRTTDGCEVKVHLPKISLVYNLIQMNTETKDHYAYDKRGNLIATFPVKLNQACFIKNDQWFDMQIVKRQMTKKQIEKELGYQIKIMED